MDWLYLIVIWAALIIAGGALWFVLAEINRIRARRADYKRRLGKP